MGAPSYKNDLAVRLAHGTCEFFLVVDGHAAPVGRGLIGIYVRLAAGVIVAGVGVRVVRAAAAADAIERVGARGDGLCLERLLLKRGGHFRAQHAEKVCAHVHLLGPRPEFGRAAFLRCRARRGRRSHRSAGEIPSRPVCVGVSSKRPAAAQARIQMRPINNIVMRRSCFKACSSLRPTAAMLKVTVFLSVYDRLVRKMIHGQTGMSVLSSINRCFPALCAPYSGKKRGSVL